ncbi:hypothetical protein HYY72_04090 [Candidatus Woesearchaeota archaeon]|nr:hypothetical protein [Candidatus Woesearchaeota archaeon]
MVRKEVLVSCISETDALKAELEMALKGVREELDEHLETVNQTTEEVQSNYEYLCRLDEKIELISARVEQVVLLLSKDGKSIEEKNAQEYNLTEKEKAVFLVLYTAEKRMLTYREIAQGVRDSEFLVRTYITSLIQKSIPIRKRYIGNVAHVELDHRFKELQAKTNVLNLSQKTVKEFL